MRQLRRGIVAWATVWALLLALVPTAATAAVDGARVGDNAGFLYTGDHWADRNGCDEDDDGHGGTRGTLTADDASGVYYLWLIHTIQDGSTHVAGLDVCGELERAPATTIQTALGAACELYPEPGNFYSNAGRGQMTHYIDGDTYVTEVRNLQWSPSNTGTLVATADYVDDAAMPGASEGTLILTMQTFFTGGLCLTGYVGPSNHILGATAMVPSP